MIYLIPPHRKITSNDDAMAATKQQQHRRLKVAPSSLLMAATFSAIVWQIILVTVVFVPPIQSAATLIGDHICYRNESFTELEQHRSTEPVRIREYTWCLGFPPRCSKYRNDIKEIIKYQNVTKQRFLKECCEGYAELPVNGDKNTTKCMPNCPEGCDNGVCIKPQVCECFIGYQGRNCTKECEKGKWGLNCLQTCNCPSFSCDPVSGVCIECMEGWTGHSCNTKCPKSYYGRDCKLKCDSCPQQECDFKSGECLIKPTTTTTEAPTTVPLATEPPTTTTTGRTTEQTPIKLSPRRTSESLPLSSSLSPPSDSFSTEYPLSSSSSSPPTTITTTPTSPSLHTIHATSTNNSMAITVLNTSISSLETDVKKLERQVDEHKRLIVSSSTTTSPVGLTFVHLSTSGTLTAEEDAAAADQDPSVLISAHEDAVEVPLDTAPTEVIVHWDSSSSGGGSSNTHQETNTTRIEDRVERHGSILIALIAALCVVAIGCLGYICLRWRCFIFPAKSGKVGPMHATELSDVKAVEKPLPAIPLGHEEQMQGHRMRSGSVKSVTFDENLTYYGGDAREEAEKPPEVGTFEYHIYDEVKYPPTLTDQKVI